MEHHSLSLPLGVGTSTARKDPGDPGWSPLYARQTCDSRVRIGEQPPKGYLMPRLRSAHIDLPPRPDRGSFTALQRRCAEMSWPVGHDQASIARYLTLLATVLILALAGAPAAYAASARPASSFEVQPTAGPLNPDWAAAPGTLIRLSSHTLCPPPKNAPAPTVDVGIPFTIPTGGGRRGQGTAWPINANGSWTGSIPTYTDIPPGSYPIFAQCYAENINSQTGQSPYFSYPLGTFKVAAGNPPEVVLLDEPWPSKNGCSVTPSGQMYPTGCEGRRIVSFGADLTQASHIVVRVFGINNSYPYTAADVSAQDSAARALSATIDDLYTNRVSDTAVVSWLGYDPPTASAPTTFIKSAQAVAGGSALSAFLAGLRFRSKSPTGVTFTVIGHSYGSIVAAWAARGQDQYSKGLLATDNLVFVGSPGVDVSSASLLDVARIYVGKNPNDLVPRTAINSRDRQPLATLAHTPLFENLFGPTLAFATGLGHSNDPATPAFLHTTRPGQTAQRFGTDGECGHEYFATHPPLHSDQRTFSDQSLANMAAIAEGDYESGSVTGEHRPAGLPAVTSSAPLPLPIINVQIADDCASLNSSVLSWTKDAAVSAAVSAATSLAKAAAGLGSRIGSLTHTAIQATTASIEQLGQQAQTDAQTVLHHLPRPAPLPNFSINVSIFALPFSFPARDRASLQASSAAAKSPRQRVLIATGRHVVGPRRVTKLTLTFTKAGRQLLAKQAALRLQVTVRLQLRGHTLSTASGTKSVRLHH
jgi:pimeloyl-ACP methyl ester carboxylesterase